MTALRSGRVDVDHHQGPLWLRIDVSIILVSLGLLAIGLLTVYSATRGIGDVPDRSFIEKQIVFVAAGLIGAVAMAVVDYRKVRPFVPFAYAGAVVLLVGLFAFGSEFNNATSWYSFGFATLQPSEFAKISLILALAAWFSHTQQSGEGMRFLDVLVGALLAGFLGFLVLLQPDYGTVMVYGAVIAGIVLIAGVRLWQVAALFAAIVVGISVAFASGRIAEYQLNRFTAFADPETALRYNVDQSEIAIGNGGITGQGLFEGTQNNASLVPEKETDFIFSVIGEELGFVGGGLMLGLFGLLLIRIWRVAHLAENQFGRLICVGVFSMFLFQGFQSVGMNMGMMPVTGIPLPLISYGGSSMVTSLMALGLVQNVHAHRLR